MKSYLFVLAGVALSAGVSFAGPICPTTSNNATGADASGCGVLITYTSAGPALTLPGTGLTMEVMTQQLASLTTATNSCLL